MKNIRIVAMLLSMFLLLASCGEPTPVETDHGLQETESIIVETETKSPLDALSGKNYEGHDFRIVYIGYIENYDKYIDCEEFTGDLLNDTSYERYNKVQDLLNVSFSYHPLEPTNKGTDYTIVGRINNLVAADDDAYDYLQFWSANDNCAVAIKAGSLVNLYDVPCLNLDAKYYYPASNEAMTINNKLYFGFSSYNNAGGAPTLMVFNKNLMTDLGLEMPYNTIMEGNWTFDTFLGMIKDTSADLDGNGKMDGKDRWGYANIGGLTNYLCYGFNISVLKRDEKGSYILALRDEQLINAFQKIIEFRSNNKDSLNDTNGYFKEGRALFSTTGGGGLDLSDLRTIDSFDFGVAPYPKWDENQKNYYSYQGLDQFGIPVTERNMEMTGAVSEALAIYSYEMMTPAFIDIYLEYKIMRDKESTEILQMMMQSVVADVIRYFDFTDNEIKPVWLLNKMDDSGTVVSVIAQIENSAAAKAEEFFAMFFDN